MENPKRAGHANGYRLTRKRGLFASPLSPNSSVLHPAIQSTNQRLLFKKKTPLSLVIFLKFHVLTRNPQCLSRVQRVEFESNQTLPSNHLHSLLVSRSLYITWLWHDCVIQKLVSIEIFLKYLYFLTSARGASFKPCLRSLEYALRALQTSTRPNVDNFEG